MSCTSAPACAAVRSQATKLWPRRSQKSDGTCASPEHTVVSPGSDHEPHVVIRGVAYATAVDLTDDKAGGCDADAWAEWLRTTRDPRVKYVICNRRMFSSYATSKCPAWTWRTYTGANPHEKHTHLSILPGAVFDTTPWFPPAETPATPTPPVVELEELPTMYAFRDQATRHVIVASGFYARHVERPELEAFITAGALGTAEHRKALGWKDGTHGPLSEPPVVTDLRNRLVVA